MTRLVHALFLLAIAWPLQAVEPFFSPAVPQGSLDVQLHPTEAVGVGVPTLVTFGLPFPRGSVTEVGLGNLRVLRNGIEIPAHVAEMTPWRHRSNPAIDGQSVRVALVQITYSFTAAFPASETITLQWGAAARALNVPSLVDPRSAWHRVTGGSFVAADNVFEPDVYAVLPRSWLVRGALKSSRSTPFDATNMAPRDSPAANDAILTWPEFQEAERAFKNNFYSSTLRDDPSVPLSASGYPQYKTAREPWLYDRSATMFVLYFRSGYFTALREAVQAAQFYVGLQNPQGFFTMDLNTTSDTKYAYNESLAYTWWLTGDAQMLLRIAAVSSAQNSSNHVWTPLRNFWTERDSAFKLLGKVVAYEVLGGASRRDEVTQILADFRAHQDGAGGQIPSPRIDGGLYHTGNQHAGDWGGLDYGGSSWMTALLSDAAVRAYASGEDAQTAQFIARLGDFMRATIVVSLEHSYPIQQPLAQPRYAMLRDGSDGRRNIDDIEHALDVAGQLAWARYFRESLGADGDSLGQATRDLYASYDIGVNFWIRPAAPPVDTAYRISPPRKWGWEHRTSDGLAFALIEADPNDIFANGFEAP